MTNAIGTDLARNNALANTGEGVRIDGGSSNKIGGFGDEFNVISGNRGSGVLIRGNATATVIAGNLIGTNVQGTQALPNGNSNGGAGVEIVGVSGTTIGGRTSGSGNVISGNRGAGVLLSDSTNTTITANRIGTNAAGNNALANSQDGVRIMGGSGHVIGGDDRRDARANVISGNSRDGVRIDGGMNMRVRENYISINAQDASVGNGENGVRIIASSNIVVGRLSTNRPNSSFQIYYFSNSQCGPPQGFGQGRTLIGDQTVTTDGAGIATFESTQFFSTSSIITAIAEDSNRNTSEFSNCPSGTDGSPVPPPLAAGDANADLQFDLFDIIEVLKAGKYRTGQPATFAEGDWNGDGVFDQFDVIEALKTGL